MAVGTDTFIQFHHHFNMLRCFFGGLQQAHVEEHVPIVSTGFCYLQQMIAFIQGGGETST